MLKQTTVYNINLHLHAKFKSCCLKLDAVCTVSSFSLVQGYDTFSFVLLSNVAPCLSQTCSG